MAKEKKRIGELLIDAGLIDEYQLTTAIGHQKQWGGRIVNILINMGLVDEKTVVSILEKQLGIKSISLEDTKISQKTL
ncbi:MAG: general secretion pathway protein GspE, partial [Thermodesulfovibrionia bacterium]|nr:general secretion pathway protein GspE [Thermodesulfovibrionia bacterium]